MALLLDDLFDISHISLGKRVLRKEQVDLRTVIEAASLGCRLRYSYDQAGRPEPAD
ncbi:hypothetical protein [Stutzerimonas stutzeri]|uniref:hypothetical protein n=1 Tax=Stutzerimonas stutzeri TaxID=316 RepID=UPI00210A5768|nr:hypothetical protein [Stutzerimonas stutzeri]MCQ4318874.1 hypothetical protein [Stutzerimonas stutzeri]